MGLKIKKLLSNILLLEVVEYTLLMLGKTPDISPPPTTYFSEGEEGMKLSFFAFFL